MVFATNHTVCQDFINKMWIAIATQSYIAHREFVLPSWSERMSMHAQERKCKATTYPIIIQPMYIYGILCVHGSLTQFTITTRYWDHKISSGRLVEGCSAVSYRTAWIWNALDGRATYFHSSRLRMWLWLTIVYTEYCRAGRERGSHGGRERVWSWFISREWMAWWFDKSDEE